MEYVVYFTMYVIVAGLISIGLLMMVGSLAASDADLGVVLFFVFGAFFFLAGTGLLYGGTNYFFEEKSPFYRLDKDTAFYIAIGIVGFILLALLGTGAVLAIRFVRREKRAVKKQEMDELEKSRERKRSVVKHLEEEGYTLEIREL